MNNNIPNGLEGYLVFVVGGKTTGLISHYPRQVMNLGADKVIVTNTNAKSEKQVIEHIFTNVQDPKQTGWDNYNLDNFYTAQVQSSGCLLDLYDNLSGSMQYERYFKDKKVLTIIAGKDPKEGDNVHADYAKEAEKRGHVHCEKPFTRDQLSGANSWIRNISEDKFNLNLQMTYLREALSEQHQNSPVTKVVWSTGGTPQDAIIDVGPHVFSVIDKETLETLKIDKHLFVNNKHAFIGHSKQGTIELYIDSNNTGIRGFEIGNTAYQNEGTGLIAHPGINLENVLQVTNPAEAINCGDLLQRSILSVVDGNPVCGPQRAYESELFLRKLKESMK